MAKVKKTAEKTETSVAATPHQADATTTKAVVYSYYAAVNDGRWSDVVEYFHDDASLTAAASASTTTTCRS